MSIQRCGNDVIIIEGIKFPAFNKIARDKKAYEELLRKLAKKLNAYQIAQKKQLRKFHQINEHYRRLGDREDKHWENYTNDVREMFKNVCGVSSPHDEARRSEQNIDFF